MQEPVCPAWINAFHKSNTGEPAAAELARETFQLESMEGFKLEGI